MKNEIVVKARQTGKTTQLMKEFNNYEGVAYYITPHSISKEIRDMYVPSMDKSTCSMNHFILTGSHYDRITHLFIDEYFFMTLDQKRFLFNYLIMSDITFTVMSTSNRLYDEDRINDCKFWWKLQQAREHVNVLRTESEMEEEYGTEYLYNLLAFPNVKVFSNHEYQLMLPKDTYATDIEGKLWKKGEK